MRPTCILLIPSAWAMVLFDAVGCSVLYVLTVSLRYVASIVLLRAMSILRKWVVFRFVTDIVPDNWYIYGYGFATYG